MQIIESSNFGVRAAIHTFKSPNLVTEFRLLPMIHIAEKEYYENINRLLDTCDLFIFESAQGFQTKFITASYCLLKYRFDLNLSLQKEFVKPLRYGQKAIHADYTPETFKSQWQHLTLKQRCLLLFYAPLYGVYRLFTESRNSLIKTCGTEDLQSREDILRFEDHQELENFLLDARDKKVFKTIDKQIQCDRKRIIGILYGAGHMSSIIAYIRSKYNYRAYQSEWYWVIQAE